jgi:hypothetical protein
LHSLGTNEYFGDSKIIHQVTKEDLGDLYACLYPSKKNQHYDALDRNPEKIIKDKMKLSDLLMT